MEETVSLSANSYIIHPNLVNMSLGGSFGFSQNQITQDSGDSSSNGTIQSYNTSAIFLQKEFMPISVFAARTNTQSHSQFSGTQEVTSDNYGANLIFRSKKIPSQFHVRHSKISVDDSLGTGSYETIQDSFAWHSDTQPTDRQKLSLDLSFDNYQQHSNNITSTTQTQDISASHTVLWGDNDKYSLNSSLNYSQNAGAFERTYLNLSESLSIRFSDTLRSNAHYTYQHNQQKTNDQITHRASVDVTHRLYKSLTTTARGSVEYTNNNGDSTSLEKSASINLDYHKMVPLGSLNITLSGSYTQTDSTQTSSTNTVVGETYTYISPNDVFINHRNIVNGSILVYNASPYFPYTEGSDYTLDYTSDFVLLTVIPGGLINNNAILSIDYTTTADPTNSTTTIGQGISIHYSFTEGWFRGLSLYASFYTQNQTIDSQYAYAFTPDQSTDIGYGANYSIGNLTLRAAFHDHQSDTSPYKTSNFSAIYSKRISARTAWFFSTTYNISDYPSQNSQTTSWQVENRFNQKLGQNFYGSVAVIYRNSNSTTGQKLTGYDQTFSLQWQHRQTSVYLTGHNTITNTQSQDTLSQALEIGIRRSF
jgi:hypothetical protein